MSVVAIRKITKGKFEIASDSIVIIGSTQSKDATSKLWKLNNIIIGSVGTCSLGMIFKEYVEHNKPKFNTEYGWMLLMSEFSKYISELTDSLRLSENSFIVIYEDKAFLIDDLYVREIDEYSAIGAGADYALSALYLGHSAEDSVNVACELSIYCEKPINKYNN